MAKVEARELDLPSVSNGLEAFGMSTGVQQEHNDKEHHPFEITCLSVSSEIVEAHSKKASGCNSVQLRFQFGRNKVQYFSYLRNGPVPQLRGSCVKLCILVMHGLSAISNSSACSYLLTVKTCTYHRTDTF